MSVRQIYIAGFKVGIINLDEIFKSVRESEIEDEKQLKDLLLQKVKTQNYVPANMEEVYKEDLLEEYKVFTGEIESRSLKKGQSEIRVYGPGCSKCEQLNRMVKDILASKGISVEYQYIKDVGEMASKGIVLTPALTINDKIVLTGKVPSKQALEKLIIQALGGESLGTRG